MCVAAVGAEGQGDGRVKDAELAHHLLHAPDGALLVRVSKLDHQAGRGALKGKRRWRVTFNLIFIVLQSLPIIRGSS